MPFALKTWTDSNLRKLPFRKGPQLEVWLQAGLQPQFSFPDPLDNIPWLPHPSSSSPSQTGDCPEVPRRPSSESPGTELFRSEVLKGIQRTRPRSSEGLCDWPTWLWSVLFLRNSRPVYRFGSEMEEATNQSQWVVWPLNGLLSIDTEKDRCQSVTMCN